MAGITVTRPSRSTLVTVPRRTVQAHGRKGNWLPFWLLLPSILILLALQVYPAVYAVFLSLTRLRRGEAEFIGLDNYIRLFRSPSFIEGLQKTFIYAGGYILLTVVLGMCLALLLNRKFRFTGVYLVILFIPWVLSDVVAGTMWRWLFQPSYGLVQEWITANVPFIQDKVYTSQNGSMLIVIFASAWQGLAFTTILSLGALQTVPNDILESAAIDGANRLQRFLKIILPIARPTLLVMLLLVSIRAVNSVGLIYATTGGGPGRATQTASVYLLLTGWKQGEFGLGAAVSVVLLAVNILLTLAYLFVIVRRTDRVAAA